MSKVGQFSADGLASLHVAGWSEDRFVPIEIYDSLPFEFFPVARDVLSRFGELDIGKNRPGVHRGANRFRVRPSLAAHLKIDIDVRSREIGHQLYPLGEVSHGDAHAVIDDEGSIYLLFHNFLRITDTFAEAIDYIVLGR